MVLSNKLEMTGNIWEVRMTTDDEDGIKLKGITKTKQKDTNVGVAQAWFDPQ